VPVQHDVVLTEAAVREATDAARLHHEQLPGSFLASLGPGFLRVLYRRLVLDGSSTVHVARDGDRVVGFVAGTEDTARFMRRFVRRDGPRAAVAGAAGLLRRPGAAWETLRYGPAPPEVAGLPAAELLALAVDPSARRMGLGLRLIESLLEDARVHEIPGMRVTVAADNAAAIAAYERAGFRRATRTEVHRGRTSEVLVWP
jgi:ribosomal protein S18 acetylase RimI-like enzyme